MLSNLELYDWRDNYSIFDGYLRIWSTFGTPRGFRMSLFSISIYTRLIPKEYNNGKRVQGIIKINILIFKIVFGGVF